MPVTKTTKRRPKQNERKRAINKKRTLEMRKLIKEANTLIAAKDTEAVEKMLPQIYKAIDKAAKKGVIKKNTAARKKSRMMKKIKKINPN
ncbi:MAG TPA: 30S ribosomal protein S20 [Candidatus Pacearchaeota archaeon]|nr:30S ribosomal protein S20 [Candidatus Pacearchaeota archaeon]HOS12607.1 30S ribosomal protein S20 [Candidatus Pacearchaeota archaeon]HPL72805.1 30S ribosomal protein S20 [Candidatus Pacearchaeota archaeon]HRT18048.1 30S ribosomal protein S20 [Candidatus Paceibacterota bacterium]